MKLLVVYSHPVPESFNAAVRDVALKALGEAGHEVRLLDLHAEGFDPVMSAEDRRAYETEDAIVDPHARRHADLVNGADALVFVYPTVTGGLPAMLKGWLDRVLVTGVAFVLDPRTNKVKPAMRHIRRIGVVTVNPSRRLNVALVNDAGRRTLTRTLRLICRPTARRTFKALYRSDHRSAVEQNIFRDGVEKAFRGWA